jgi:hypothetical protein
MVVPPYFCSLVIQSVRDILHILVGGYAGILYTIISHRFYISQQQILALQPELRRTFMAIATFELDGSPQDRVK